MGSHPPAKGLENTRNELIFISSSVIPLLLLSFMSLSPLFHASFGKSVMTALKQSERKRIRVMYELFSIDIAQCLLFFNNTNSPFITLAVARRD